MKRIFFVIFFLVIPFSVPYDVSAVDCSPEQNGTTFTVNADCTFPSTQDGVDAGTGTSNTAVLKVADDVTLTLQNTQTIAVGSLVRQPGAQIIIPEGAVIHIRRPIWVDRGTDLDADNHYTGAGGGNAEVSQSTPSGKMRKNQYAIPEIGDCNDNPAISPDANKLWKELAAAPYEDLDNDGYGPQKTGKTCSDNAVYANIRYLSTPDTNDVVDYGTTGKLKASVTGSDCNDADINCYTNTTCYTDADNDAYRSNTSSSVCSTSSCPSACSATYKLASGATLDCDDASAGCAPAGTCYSDQDGDGYAGSTSSSSACKTNPGNACSATCDATYKYASTTDCNDTGTNSANVSTSATCYTDADDDGYGVTPTTYSCITQGVTCAAATWASGGEGTTAVNSTFSAIATDCSDGSNSVYQNLSCYTDTDGDGYTTAGPASTCCGSACGTGCTGKSAASSGADCNDTGANATNVYTSATCYTDADDDGYGVTPTTYSCIGKADHSAATCATATWASGGAGTAATSGNFDDDATDCNDTGTSSANVYISATCYTDADDDGYGVTPTTYSCTNNATCATATWASGGAGTAAVNSTFSANSTDCKDTGTNPGNVYTTSSCYRDGDDDGYGTGTEYTCIGKVDHSAVTCATATWGSVGSGGVPVNDDFAALSTDCYDSNANAYPGSSNCGTSDRGDGSFDYNCGGTEVVCGTRYYGSGASRYTSCTGYSCAMEIGCTRGDLQTFISTGVACGVSGYAAGASTIWYGACGGSCGATCIESGPNNLRGTAGTQGCY